MRTVYVMQEIDNQNVSDATLKKADGIVVRTKWSTIEPKDGQFNLTWLRGQLDRAVRMGKKVHLQVLGGHHSPTWLKAAGCKFAKANPLPWDITYQDQYQSMMAVVGVKCVMSPVSLISAPGDGNAEWFYGESGIYQHKDYTDTLMVRAHEGLLARLTGMVIGVPIVFNIGDHTRKWTGIAIDRLRGYGAVTAFQMCSLSAKTSTSFAGYTRIKELGEEGFDVGFEMLCPSVTRSGVAVSRFGGKYATAIAKANATEASWLSIYQDDLRFPQV